jgi:hypothetical protein
MPGDPGLPGFWAPQLLQRPETGEKGTPRGPRPAVLLVYGWFMGRERGGAGKGGWCMVGNRFAVNIHGTLARVTRLH